MKILTSKEIELIKSCWKSGTIRYMDIQAFYKTAISIRETINHLKALNIITEEKFYFVINRTKFIQIQNEDN